MDPTARLAPPPSAFVSSPRRHRLRVRLDASPTDVWALVGDHERLPEYSSGIARVELVPVEAPRGEARVCHFHPMPGATEGLVIRERVRWVAPGAGYATSAEPGDAFGLREDLSLVTLETAGKGTILTWDQHYEADDPAMVAASFEEGLADIGANLVRLFGGTVLEGAPHAPSA